MARSYGNRRLVSYNRYAALIPAAAGYLAQRMAYDTGKHYASKAGNYVMNKISKATSTTPKSNASKSTATAAAIRRMGPGSGVLRGFIKTKWRARRRGRRARKIVKRNVKGVSYQTEYVGSLTGDKCLFLGHSTALPEELLLTLVMGCMKNVMIEAGITINSWPELRNGYIVNGDIFQFVYKPTPFAVHTAANTTYAVIPADLSYYDIALKLALAIQTSFIANLLPDALILTEFQYVAVGGRVIKCSLQDCLVNYFVKSSLKIQNRSVVTAGDDEIDVNNVPVYGKLYHGTGNGMIQRTVDQISFICGPRTATNIAVNGSAVANYSEPPDASEFTHVNSFNKAYFNPGNIKTSVLKFKTSINVTKLFIKLMHYFLDNASSEWFDLGKFNCYGLERVIAKLPGEPSPAMTLVYEVDNKFYATVKPGQQKFTAPMRVVL